MLRLALMRLRGPLAPPDRARWLQSACRGVVRSLGLRCTVAGTPPSQGLVVSNHLSYLDIAIYSAAMPCVFVSKAEVRRWPYFGIAARASGTVFVDRTSRAGAAVAAAEMLNRLKMRIPVLLFPEGTSTDGAQVLRFHSSLFQPAIEASVPVTAAAIRYVIQGSIAERVLCWYGDEPFFSNLWRALGAPPSSAEVLFGSPAQYDSRRQAAQVTHELVVEMRGAKSLATQLAVPASS
jgi:1-acyl-sn-glycerol-3-phosphate acyltransferase